jgi:hypothetical protein
VRWALIVYAVGIVLALWRTDASWPARLAIALLWPIGPAAFVITVAILLAASLIAFPLVAAATIAIAGIGWWLLTYS